VPVRWIRAPSVKTVTPVIGASMPAVMEPTVTKGQCQLKGAS
jgi:hypothetical protein